MFTWQCFKYIIATCGTTWNETDECKLFKTSWNHYNPCFQHYLILFLSIWNALKMTCIKHHE